MVEKINPKIIHNRVQEHYGEIAEKARTGPPVGCCEPTDTSCCGADQVIDISRVSQFYQDTDVDNLPAEVTDISLGCGDPVTLAALKEGQTVLDLGSGGGIDCFLAAKKVGPTGRVIGVDMTPEMIQQAQANKDQLGAENVEFRLGQIEEIPVDDNSVDVVISNCVINLSPDKNAVFWETYRVLKPGGKLAVSDIVTDGELPSEIKTSLSAWAGCLAGALDVNDYVGAIEDAGFVDVEVKPTYWDPEIIEAAVEGLGLDSKDLVDEEELQTTIFSAKITAWKPK